MIEVCDGNGTCCGYLDTPVTPTVRVQNVDFAVTHIDMTVRVRPGQFACFKVHQLRLPPHLLGVMIENASFKPRGEVQYVRNDEDPELRMSKAKH